MAEQQAREARRAVDQAFANAAVMESRKAAVSAGTESLKLLATFNAGGLIALLGFLGAVAGKSVIYGPGVFITPMLWFGAGLLLSALAIIALYGARHYYAEAWFSNRPTGAASDVLYRPEGPIAQRHERRADCLVTTQFLCLWLALGAFIVGMATSMPIVHRIQLWPT
jgi:hypothetical protein